MTAYELRISDWSSDLCSSDLFVVALIVIDQGLAGAGAFGKQRCGFVDLALMRQYRCQKCSGDAIAVAVARILAACMQLGEQAVCLAKGLFAFGDPDRKSTRLNSSH